MCTPEMLETGMQRLQDGESQRQIAAGLGISEATLGKRLKKVYGAQSFGRFQLVFTSKQSEQLATHYKAVDRAFYGLTFKNLRRFAFQFAEANNVKHKFNTQTGMAGKDWTLSFMRKHHLSLRTPQQTSLARMMGFNRLKLAKELAILFLQLLQGGILIRPLAV